jgi:hypothetical protein
MSRAATPEDRLRMLWHLGVVRSPQLGDRSFGVLVERGWAMPQCRLAGTIDYTITERGRAMAIAQSRQR